MDKASTSRETPYKELWNMPLVGQTIDAKLDSIYEGLGEIQKLVIGKTSGKNEQRIVRRRVHFNLACDPTKPRYPSVSNMVRTFYSLEELEKEYDQVDSSEEEEILERINELQLECNMKTSGESQSLIVQESAGSGSGAPEAHLETQTNYDSHMASSPIKSPNVIVTDMSPVELGEWEEDIYSPIQDMRIH